MNANQEALLQELRTEQREKVDKIRLLCDEKRKELEKMKLKQELLNKYLDYLGRDDYLGGRWEWDSQFQKREIERGETQLEGLIANLEYEQKVLETLDFVYEQRAHKKSGQE